MLMGAMVNSPPVSDIDQKIIRARADFEDSLRIRLDRAVQDLELPPDTDTHALAGYYLAMLQGISAQARDGANSEKLEGIIRIAMRLAIGHMPSRVVQQWQDVGAACRGAVENNR